MIIDDDAKGEETEFRFGDGFNRYGRYSDYSNSESSDCTRKITSSVFFVSIMIYVGIAYFIVFVQDKVKFYLNEIKQNKEDIKELKKRLDITEKFSNFDKRLSLLEGKTK